MNRTSGRVMALVAGVVMLACLSGRADNWPRFRGPNGQGAGAAPAMPNQWTAQDWLWRISLPGAGHSSPVVWGGRVLLTSADEAAGKRFVVCVNGASGKILWQREFPLKPFRQHRDNSPAAATPAVDELGVYVAWIDPEKYTLMALDHEGRDLWSVDLGAFKSQHMNGASPIVVGQNVIMAVDQEVAGASYVIAVDNKTGRTKWKTLRRSDYAASSTPCVLEMAGQGAQIILTNRTEGIVSLDAETGKRVWGVTEALPFRSVASPVAADGIVLGCCGEGASNRMLSAVRLPGKADGKAELVWQIRTTAVPYVPTPLIVGSRLYLLSDAGQVSCVELSSGKVFWQQRIPAPGVIGFYSSLVRIDDRLVCVSKKGEIIVLSAGDRFEVLGRTPLAEASFATPAVANGRVYFRTLSKLACIGK